MTFGEIVCYGFWVIVVGGFIWFYAAIIKGMITSDRRGRKGHTYRFCKGCRYLRYETLTSSCVRDDNPEYTINYCIATGNCIREEENKDE